MSAQSPTLLYLSHLNWDHVWQRPQQLMTRFARRYRVQYIDPPQVTDEAERVELKELGVDQGVQVARPIFPARQVGSMDDYWRLWLDLLPAVLDRAGPNIILWTSSPMADQLVERARPGLRLAVYDCMDDLASFKDGTAEMREREDRLMGVADLVFTGGFSMFQAREGRHPRVHCFPSGVDVAHYRQVRDPATPVADAIAAIPGPRLGYFGVLDERVDWPLIAEVAARRPEWRWVLVGPTAKVDPAELPRAPNIHYLGQQPYERLPSLLKGFDVATMPFALNEATRYISPTKTLEYLAGGRPVISSSVPDVVAFYREIVTIADGPDAWVPALAGLLEATPEQRKARLDLAQPALEANTWDSIVGRMAALIEERLAA